MSAAKRPAPVTRQRQLSPKAKGVFVPMTPERLKRLDADRLKLGLSRGGTLASIYDRLDGNEVDAVQHRFAAAAAEAADRAQLLNPLVRVLKALGDAFDARARQRQAIGVHSNQVAKLANVERLTVRDGGQVNDETVREMALALQGVQRALDQQTQAERHDDALRAEVRAVLDEMRRRRA